MVAITALVTHHMTKYSNLSRDRHKKKIDITRGLKYSS